MYRPTIYLLIMTILATIDICSITILAVRSVILITYLAESVVAILYTIRITSKVMVAIVAPMSMMVGASLTPYLIFYDVMVIICG
jgi:hypothetical protein